MPKRALNFCKLKPRASAVDTNYDYQAHLSRSENAFLPKRRAQNGR